MCVNLNNNKHWGLDEPP